MTIITKPISEKRSDKLIVPLVENDQNANTGAAGDVEAQTPESVRMVILPVRVGRLSTTTTLCLLLTALVVVGIGIAGGTYLYQQYLRSQLRFKGWCTIPYNTDGAKTAMFIKPNIDEPSQRNDLLDGNDTFLDTLRSYLSEELELDLENQNYEKIDVPDFGDLRSGRFIHDFNTNITGIVDITGLRCFIMPLNRSMVLPPRSLSDFVQKMWKDYYKVDIEVVRETMHVVTPPISKEDLKNTGEYIFKECSSFTVYKLEKFIGGVVKRSAELGNEVKFAQFAGPEIVEFNIVNMNDLKPYENGYKSI